MRIIVALALCLTGLAATPARADTPRKWAFDSAHVVPAFFASRGAAREYVATGVEGGAVQMLHWGKRDLLVVYVYGPGLTEIAIAAYRPFADGWKLLVEWKPTTVESHNVVVENGALVAIGDPSHKRWVLLKPGADESPR